MPISNLGKLLRYLGSCFPVRFQWNAPEATGEGGTDPISSSVRHETAANHGCRNDWFNCKRVLHRMNTSPHRLDASLSTTTLHPHLPLHDFSEPMGKATRQLAARCSSTASGRGNWENQVPSVRRGGRGCNAAQLGNKTPRKHVHSASSLPTPSRVTGWTAVVSPPEPRVSRLLAHSPLSPLHSRRAAVIICSVQKCQRGWQPERHSKGANRQSINAPRRTVPRSIAKTANNARLVGIAPAPAPSCLSCGWPNSWLRHAVDRLAPRFYLMPDELQRPVVRHAFLGPHRSTAPEPCVSVVVFSVISWLPSMMSLMLCHAMPCYLMLPWLWRREGSSPVESRGTSLVAEIWPDTSGQGGFVFREERITLRARTKKMKMKRNVYCLRARLVPCQRGNLMVNRDPGNRRRAVQAQASE